MADKRFTDFDSRVQLLTGDFFVGYKEDGSAEFRTRLSDLIEALRPYFAPLPSPSVYNIDTDEYVFNAISKTQYYFKIDSNITKFYLTLNSISGVTFTNYFDPANFNNCKLQISTTSRVSSTASEVYVTGSVTLSTDVNEFFTFYYFNTGSIIAGLSDPRIPLQVPNVSMFVPSTPTPTPTPTETPTPTPTPTETPTPTPTPTETPTPTPTPTPTSTSLTQLSNLTFLTEEILYSGENITYNN